MTTKNQPPYESAISKTATSDALRETIEDARELVRIELQLAKNDLFAELRRGRTAAIGFGVCVVALLVVLDLFALALVLALGATAAVTLGVAGIFLIVAAGGAAFGYARIPKKPLGPTRDRLRDELEELKEHVA
jgi:hypothetical protein